MMLSEITELEMRTLIEFMYCGEATIDQSQLEALLKVSEQPITDVSDPASTLLGQSVCQYWLVFPSFSVHISLSRSKVSLT